MRERRIQTTSMGFDIFDEDSRSAALPAKWLGPDESKEVYRYAASRLPMKLEFCWESFPVLGLDQQEGLRRIAQWLGDHVFALCLDNVDERVLRIPKDWLGEYFENYVLPSDHTYILSSDRKHCICFDRHDVCHYSPVV